MSRSGLRYLFLAEGKLTSIVLFKQITISSVYLKNRIVMFPMYTHSVFPDGIVSDFPKVHYGARALGGVGLVFLETMAALLNEPVEPGDIDVWDVNHIFGLTSMVSTIHNIGASKCLAWPCGTAIKN